jgi:hypothetical protein
LLGVLGAPALAVLGDLGPFGGMISEVVRSALGALVDASARSRGRRFASR